MARALCQALRGLRGEEGFVLPGREVLIERDEAEVLQDGGWLVILGDEDPEPATEGEAAEASPATRPARPSNNPRNRRRGS